MMHGFSDRPAVGPASEIEIVLRQALERDLERAGNLKPIAEMKKRGVEFTDEISDQGYGLVTHFKMPGGVEVSLYQPRYTKKSKGK